MRLHVLFDDYFQAFVAAAAAAELVDAEHEEEQKVLKVGQKQDGDEGHAEDHHKENAVHDEEEEFVEAAEEEAEDDEVDDNIESNIEAKREKAITDMLKKEDLGIVQMRLKDNIKVL